VTLTRICLGNPVAVKVAVILALIFGALSLFRLPIQLIPEVEEPEITIRTTWRAAAPNEVEAEIIEPQEDVLRGLPGMTELTATASEGRGEINISFAVGIDMRRALVEVLNRCTHDRGLIGRALERFGHAEKLLRGTLHARV